MTEPAPNITRQRYTRWFTDYPSTHEQAGQTVEVVPVAALEAAKAELAKRDKWLCATCNTFWTGEQRYQGVKCPLCPREGCSGLLMTPEIRAEAAEAEVERLHDAIDALAQDGDLDRWMRLAHLDRRNGTTEARDAIRLWFAVAPEREAER